MIGRMFIIFNLNFHIQSRYWKYKDFDDNYDGKICPKELRSWLMKRGKPLTFSQSLTVIKGVDMDDDEMIGKDDLCSIIKRTVVFKGALIQN